jgi:antitoxin YefM
MKTATFTDFRQKLKEHLNEIENNQDILILSGPKKKDFVVLTLDQFNAMEETAHLLSTAANAERLSKSIAQDKAGKVTVRGINLSKHEASHSKKRASAKRRSKVVRKKA